MEIGGLKRACLARSRRVLVRVFLPSFCVNCQKETPEEPASLRWLCLSCHRLLTPHWREVALKPEIDRAWSIFDYQKDALAKKLIHALKYEFVKEVANTFFVALEKEKNNFKKLADKWNIDFVMPIPLHPRRLKGRGFNQSTLLAQKVSELTQREIHEDILKRKFSRLPQMNIKERQERIANVKNIFEPKEPEMVKNKNILLVDDVVTTGATLKEAALVLKRAGAKKVFAFVLARD